MRPSFTFLAAVKMQNHLVPVFVGLVDELTDLGDVAAAVLHPDDVGVAAQVDDHVNGEVNP